MILLYKKDPKKTVTAELKINSLDSKGRGVAKFNKKSIFIQGALPNEVVTVKVDQHAKYSLGSIQSILTPNQDMRIPAKCKYAASCGGCALQHMNFATERSLKTMAELQDLQEAPIEFLANIASERFMYRSVVRLSTDKKGSIVGFKAGKTNSIIPIRSCEVISSSMNLALQHLQKYMQLKNTIPCLAHVELYDTGIQQAIYFKFSKHLGNNALHELTTFFQDFTVIIKIADKYITPASLSYTVKVGNQEINYSFTPDSFIQSNLAVNAKLLTVVQQEIKPTDRVLDLFCGIGNLSLAAATQAKSVHGVEVIARAVTEATENAQKNNFRNTKFTAADLSTEDFFKKLTEEEQYDVVILDPPRTGANTAVQNILTHVQPKVIIYVSCSKDSLLQDAKLLCEHKYAILSTRVLEMFPNTVHSESITIFKRQ